MVKPNSELTVVLTLKDRVQFTFRWISYANFIRFPFKVLIADGGADDRVERVLSSPQNFPNLEYKYIRYPYDQTYAQFYAKLADAMNRVDTPFVVHADNDDFFLVDGLAKSVDFLKSHEEFSSCRGIIAGVRIEPNSSYGELSQVYGKDICFVKEIYPPGSTLDDTAAERIRNQFSHYRTNWYDVFRSEQAQADCQLLKELNISDLILSQHIPHLMGNVAGKINRGPYFYLVRQLEGPDSTDRNETKEKGDHFDRMLLENWSSEFNRFLDTIASAISTKDGIEFDKARNLVKQGYRDFMAPSIIGSLQAAMRTSSSPSLYRRMMQAARPIARFIRKQFRLMRGVMPGQPWELRFIPGRRFAASNKDFRLLYDFLTNPDESKAGTGSEHS